VRLNRTSEALVAALGGQPRRVLEEVPFSSARKWSALLIDDQPALRGTYVLGAPEMLAPSARPPQELLAKANEWTTSGLRVLLFAYWPDAATLHDREGEPRLPVGLVPLGLVSLGDELRPGAHQTLAGFAEAGIQLKILSGDSPSTVLALARQAGLAPDSRAVSGLELADLDSTRLGEVASENTVFGRVTPSQKEQLVQALRDRGHYVGMIGDGVNDVLSLKQANLGIAMHSGSQAARAVADLILLDDRFEVTARGVPRRPADRERHARHPEAVPESHPGRGAAHRRGGGRSRQLSAHTEAERAAIAVRGRAPVQIAPSQGHGGTHASPSTHPRRAHWQRYRHGSSEDWHYEHHWVPPLLVNPQGTAAPRPRLYRLPPPELPDDGRSELAPIEQRSDDQEAQKGE
jgi:phosphoglycolate phosphatase-like HAD superfamily hydrolase